MRYIDYEDGLHGLIFEEFYTKEEFFDEHAVENTAYTWEEIVQYILNKENPGLLSKLAFDCESSTFVVRSKSREGLQIVEKVLKRLFEDENLLKELFEILEF